MKNKILGISLILAFTLWSCQTETKPPTKPETQQQAAEPAETNPAKKLIIEMVNALGGIEKYHQLEDVTYEYTYQDSISGKKDVSTERYIFKNELSWATYTERSYRTFPDLKGVLTQSYDGNEAWAAVDDVISQDSALIRRADFSRKTNFYWFAMMFKLLDPGLNYELLEDQKIGEQNYHRVKITFGENIGDAQDIYLLYLNPETKLADQFLFTVMDFKRADPLLMQVKYKEIEGLKWPVYRRYTPSDWDANIAEDAEWKLELSDKFKFNTGLNPAFFSKR